MFPHSRCVPPILLCSLTWAFPSALLVSMWTRENVKGFPGLMGQGEPTAQARFRDLMPCCIHTGLQGLLFDILEEAERTDPWFADLCLDVNVYLIHRSTDFQSPGSGRHWDAGGPNGAAASSGPPAICWWVFCRESHTPLCPYLLVSFSKYLLSFIAFSL